MAAEAEKMRRQVRQASKKAAAKAIEEAQRRLEEERALKGPEASVEAIAEAALELATGVGAPTGSTADANAQPGSPKAAFDPSPYMQGVSIRSVSLSKKKSKKSLNGKKKSRRARAVSGASETGTIVSTSESETSTKPPSAPLAAYGSDTSAVSAAAEARVPGSGSLLSVTSVTTADSEAQVPRRATPVQTFNADLPPAAEVPARRKPSATSSAPSRSVSRTSNMQLSDVPADGFRLGRSISRMSTDSVSPALTAQQSHQLPQFGAQRPSSQITSHPTAAPTVETNFAFNLPTGASYAISGSSPFGPAALAGQNMMGLAVTGTSFGMNLNAPAGRPAQQYANASLKRKSNPVKRPEHVAAVLAATAAKEALAQKALASISKPVVDQAPASVSKSNGARRPLDAMDALVSQKDAQDTVPGESRADSRATAQPRTRPMSADALVRSSSGAFHTPVENLATPIVRSPSLLAAAGQAIVRESAGSSSLNETTAPVAAEVVKVETSAPQAEALAEIAASIASTDDSAVTASMASFNSHLTASQTSTATDASLGSTGSGNVSLFRISRSTEFQQPSTLARPTKPKAALGDSVSSLTASMSAITLGRNASNVSTSGDTRQTRGGKHNSDPRTEMVGSNARKQELLNRLLHLYSGGAGAHLKLTTTGAGNLATAATSSSAASTASSAAKTTSKAGGSPSLFSLAAGGPVKVFPLGHAPTTVNS